MRSPTLFCTRSRRAEAWDGFQESVAWKLSARSLLQALPRHPAAGGFFHAARQPERRTCVRDSDHIEHRPPRVSPPGDGAGSGAPLALL